MKNVTCAMLIMLFLCTAAYGIVPAPITEGAETYDWQTCLDSKANECINDCATSEDLNCKDNCTQVAKDKCISKGVVAPPSNTDSD